MTVPDEHERMRRAYQSAVAGPPPDRAGCPSPERLRALVERQGPEAERLRTLDHVMACGACRPEFELLRTAVTAAGPPRHSRPGSLALVAVLVLALGLTVIWRMLDRGPEPLRGPPGDITLISGNAPASFAWHPVPGARAYVAEVLDQKDALRYRLQTRDTAFVLPDSVGLVAGATYRWWVQAILPDGRVIRSSVDQFRR